MMCVFLFCFYFFVVVLFVCLFFCCFCCCFFVVVFCCCCFSFVGMPLSQTGSGRCTDVKAGVPVYVSRECIKANYIFYCGTGLL